MRTTACLSLPLFLLAACGQDLDRRELGDQYLPPADSLGNVDFEDHDGGADDDGPGGGPLDDDDGGPMGDGADDVPDPDIIPDFSLLDQSGNMVYLYDFCHKAVWLIEGAFW